MLAAIGAKLIVTYGGLQVVKKAVIDEHCPLSEPNVLGIEVWNIRLLEKTKMNLECLNLEMIRNIIEYISTE